MNTDQSTINILAASLRPLWAFAWRVVLALTVCRLAFVVWQWQRVNDADMLAAIFVQGLRFDLVILGLLLAIPVLCFPFLASNRFLLPAWRLFLSFLLPLALALVVFMECSTPSFIDQFDSRPNILFFEYLDSPREVGSTLWAAYKVPLILAMIIVVAVAWESARHIGKLVRPIQPTGVLPAILATPLLLFVCFGFVRSTTDHRAVNPSTVALSNDPLVNELALSSSYTALYALYETRHEESGGFRYAKIDDQQVVEQVRAAMMIEPESFTSDSLPTLHRQVLVNPPVDKKNLVVIVQESLGAEFVGSLGGIGVTPNIDRLSREGIWFTNLYATGVRSARGLEAIVSGFTPTPSKSVVKLGRAQRNFFTLAELLRNSGYDTGFIYGGEAQFDNMRRFFMNNGFDRVIDKADYENPVFTGSWGVSDEDLFNRAHEEFNAPHERPFFSLVFSSSNHSPFEFPDGRIENFDEEKNTVNNAVKYADYALGQFIEKAKHSRYWDDTVFLIVADHNSRVYGSEVIPVVRFHIPGLILGGSIEPLSITTVASQIDLAPTLLSLIGIESEHPMIGRDLTRSEVQASAGRAIMQFNGTQAYMEGDRVVVLQKNLPASQFRYRDGRLMAEAAVDPELLKKAIAHSAWSSMAYERSLYRLPAADD
jgi:phosphoglycerol transferase MdoB-like AlkP superfamily enzyme